MIDPLVRKNIRELEPYSNARAEEKEVEKPVYLNANESPYGIYNRYPDPVHLRLRQKISEIHGIDTDSIFLGNGSDEVIDMLIRVFCEPETDRIVVCPPTFTMYQTFAHILNVEVMDVLLLNERDLDEQKLLKLGENTQNKILFLCSPNNPTGMSIPQETISHLLTQWKGMIVVDEAYIQFSPHRSLVEKIEKYHNLVVLQTFSKAWGLAGLRLGICFAHPRVVSFLYKISNPYNINSYTQEQAILLLDKKNEIDEQVEIIKIERSRLYEVLSTLSYVEHVYPSDANFFLVRCTDSRSLHSHLLRNHILVRDMSGRLPQCVRITVGTPDENKKLIDALQTYHHTSRD